MTHLRFLFHTFVTVPPLPEPRSDSTSRSSSLTVSDPSPCSFFRLPFDELPFLRVEDEDEVARDEEDGVEVESVYWRRGGRGGAPIGWTGLVVDGESGPEVNEDELEREESWRRAISSRRRSASGTQDTLSLEPAESGPMMHAERDEGFGMDFEMSKPRGFLRDMPAGFGALNAEGSCGNGLEVDTGVREDVGVDVPRRLELLLSDDWNEASAGRCCCCCCCGRCRPKVLCCWDVAGSCFCCAIVARSRSVQERGWTMMDAVGGE